MQNKVMKNKIFLALKKPLHHLLTDKVLIIGYKTTP